MKALPLARQSSLIVKEVDGEILVYDQKTDKAHCLNDTAASVWKNCDGSKSVSEIAKILGAESNTNVKDEVIWLALDQLQRIELLEDAPAKPAFLAGMTRRQVVARLGIASIAIPSIVSIVSPTALAAGASCIPQGSVFCCVNPNDCCTGNCIQVANPCTLYPPNPQNSGKQCV
ncbi:MAG TPA: PqqD family protein [Pyrinomonadaceae bacterium]|nr:PqqD family protein [Pyrinomonadaceae bacterium]